MCQNSLMVVDRRRNINKTEICCYDSTTTLSRDGQNDRTTWEVRQARIAMAE